MWSAFNFHIKLYLLLLSASQPPTTIPPPTTEAVIETTTPKKIVNYPPLTTVYTVHMIDKGNFPIQ
jgi:hypothetical protein